jgi:RecA-family ATPase
MFTIETGKDFYAAKRVGPPFIVQGLVPAEGITMLFGPPSCGKTTMLWTMADDIQQGRKFLGKYATTKAETLFLNVDMPAYEVWNRMHLGNYQPEFSICDFPNHFNVTTLQIQEPGEYARLQQEAQAFQVIMIDCLADITSGLSLKDDWVPGLTIAALRALFPTQSIIVLHHSRKQTMGQFGPVPPHREDALGSNLWMAMVQSQLQLYTKGNFLSHLRVTKSQIAAMEEGDDVYVDDVGCRVELYTENDESMMLKKLARAEQSAIAMDPSYKGKLKTEKYTILGSLMSPAVSDKTITRWISRAQYQMVK